MSHKVMAITAGRREGNSEILAKIALERLAERGAETVLVNLFDYDIMACTGCEGCTMQMGAVARDSSKTYKGCVLKEKDDADALITELHSCDGVIIVVPTYDLGPSSLYLRFAQRFLAYERAFLRSIGVVKPGPNPVAALVSVGGSKHDWQSLALEGLQATMFTMSLQVIDRYMAQRVPRPGAVLLHDDIVARMKDVGDHVWDAMNAAADERTWMGDPDDGVCPNCHSSLVYPGDSHWDGIEFPWECAVCGAGGDLGINPKTGRPLLVIDPERGLVRDRNDDAARAEHLNEIMQTSAEFFERQHEIADELKRYREMKFPGVEVHR